MMMSPSSVVVVHSSSPARDFRVLTAVLPRRFRPAESTTASDSSNNNARFPLVIASSASGDGDGDGDGCRRSDEATAILVHPSSSIAAADDHESETVFPAAATTNNGNGDKTPPAAASSFAGLILNDQDELDLMAKLVSEREGLPVEQTRIAPNGATNNNGNKNDNNATAAKFVLPGGCLLTIFTSRSWTAGAETRMQIIGFMTSELAVTMKAEEGIPSSPKQIARPPSSLLPPRGSPLAHAVSMPDTTVVPTVATRNKKMDGQTSNHVIQRNNAVVITTVESKVLSFDGKYEPFPLNTEQPIPVETDLFSGRLLLVVRPPGDEPGVVDPYWNERIFSKKKRRVVMQCQGKLKYKPTGTVFAGMEISDPMKLGFIANGFCNVILKMIKSFNPAMHYSFGSKDERAHICCPASTFFERFVVTPPGGIPPEMGGLGFGDEEPPDAASARKAYRTKIDWNTEDTYSMSFHSMYVDFPTWSVVSLPVGKPLDLSLFWANSFASVVMYEVNDESRRGDEQIHLTESNRYIVSVQIKHLGKDGSAAVRSNAAVLEQDRSSDTDGDDSQWSDDQIGVSGRESISTTGDAALMPAFDEDDVYDDDDDATIFFDTVESLPTFDDTSFSMELTSSSLSVSDAFCPCWIEMFSKRGKYAKLYAFCGRNRPGRPLFRTEEMFDEVFEDKEIAVAGDRISDRISSAERTRRILGLKYAEAHMDNKMNRTRLKLFHKLPCRFDTKFLKRKEPAVHKKINGTKSGFIARAVSDRHWKEERMVLSGDELLFHHAEGSKIHYRILLASAIDIASIPKSGSDSSRLPLPSFYYLQIETFVHVTYLMFRSQEERESWLDTLGKIIDDRRSVRSFTKEIIQYDDLVHEFLRKSTMWNCQKRKLLNCRRCSFRTTRRPQTPEDTLKLAEQALRKVLCLKPNGYNDSDLREFLDCASALKDTDVYSLNEDEKIAFFLNIYHVMIMHSYIILGPPVGAEWVSYFNTIAYQVSDDIFSLAELEHNIIRAKMSYPSNFISRFVLPKSKYRFAPTRPDFRINFALNPGSLSTPTSAVPLYKAENLDGQLNKTTREFVGHTVLVKKRKGSKDDVQITLPRVCQWFAEDFGPTGSTSNVLSAIEPYLSDEKRETLRLIWNSRKNAFDVKFFNLRYPPYSFECRFLTSSSD